MAKSGGGSLKRNRVLHSLKVSPYRLFINDNGNQSNYSGEIWQMPLYPGDLRWHHMGETGIMCPPTWYIVKDTQHLCSAPARNAEPDPTQLKPKSWNILQSSWSALFKNINIMKATGRPRNFFRLTDTIHNQDWSLDWGKFATRNIFGILRWASGKEPVWQCRRCKRCGFDLWVRKIPCRRAWQPTLVFLWENPYGQSSLVDYSP